MSLVPLPDVPCVRCRLKYSHVSGLTGGSRFFLSYTGSAPSGTDCTTLAGDIETSWVAQMIGMVNTDWALEEVDVIDIATRSGFSGQWNGSEPGTASGTPMPSQTAMNVEYNISNRYRGGKPRMYVPPATTAKTDSDQTWSDAWVASATSDVHGLFVLIEGLSVGSMGTLQHVNLSYYAGFTNVENTSGRMRAAPTYRATALHSNVVSYAAKKEISSQKRRRVSTS